MATSAMPPLPPDVQQQQMPPALRFMQNAGAGQAMGNPAQSFDSGAFAKDRLNQVAALLSDVAKVLVVDKPVLMKPLQLMIQAGSMIMNDLEANSPEGGAPPSGGDMPNQAQYPSPETGAGAVSMG